MNRLLLPILLLLFQAGTLHAQKKVTDIVQIDLAGDSLEITGAGGIHFPEPAGQVYALYQDKINLGSLLIKEKYKFAFPNTTANTVMPVIIHDTVAGKDWYRYILIEFEPLYQQTNRLRYASIIDSVGKYINRSPWLQIDSVLMKNSFEPSYELNDIIAFIKAELVAKEKPTPFQKTTRAESGIREKDTWKIGTFVKNFKEEISPNGKRTFYFHDFLEYDQSLGFSQVDKRELNANLNSFKKFRQKFPLEYQLAKLVVYVDSFSIWLQEDYADKASGILRYITKINDAIENIDVEMNYDDSKASQKAWKKNKLDKNSAIQKYINSLKDFSKCTPDTSLVLIKDIALNYMDNAQCGFSNDIYARNKWRSLNAYRKKDTLIPSVSFGLRKYLTKKTGTAELAGKTNAEKVERFIIEKLGTSKKINDIPLMYLVKQVNEQEFVIQITKDTTHIFARLDYGPGKYESNFEAEVIYLMKEIEAFCATEIPGYPEKYQKKLSVQSSADGAGFKKGLNIKPELFNDVMNNRVRLLTPRNTDYTFEDWYLKSGDKSYNNNVMLAYLRGYLLYKRVHEEMKIPGKDINVECMFHQNTINPKLRNSSLILTLKKTSN